MTLFYLHNSSKVLSVIEYIFRVIEYYEKKKGDEAVDVLIETYIFFADLYFLQNFFVKVGVLFLTIKLLKIQLAKPVIRIIVIAALGTIFEIAGLFFIPNYNVFLGIVHIIELPTMVFALIWPHREYLWRAIVSGYFWVLVINGVIEILWNLIGYGWLYPLLVLAGNMIVICTAFYIAQRLRMKKGIYPVDIHRPDIIWTIKGYYDSGNCLRDPYTGKGVHIISRRLAKRLELEADNKVCIPYHSLGNSNGLIDVYYVENMRIKKDTKWIERGRVPLGVADDSLFEGKNYEMIINEEVW